jgi:hypothetical protein
MSSTILRLAALAAALCSTGAALAQNVTPPPLPPGSARVRPEAGLQEPERKRYVRAHHHKLSHRQAGPAAAGGAKPAAAGPKK